MAVQDFSKRLERTLDQPAQVAPYIHAYNAVKAIADSIKRWLSGTSARLDVVVEPGFQATIGQQLNVVVKIPGRSVEDTLFRAYLSPQGEISLDLYGEEPVRCTSEEEMQDEVLKFLDRPEIKSRMNMYRDLAKADGTSRRPRP